MLRCIALLMATQLCHSVHHNHASGKTIPGTFVYTTLYSFIGILIRGRDADQWIRDNDGACLHIRGRLYTAQVTLAFAKYCYGEVGNITWFC